VSATSRVSIALVGGLACGIVAAWSGSAVLTGVAAALEPVGTLWVNAIRMTVVPLVVALLVRAVAGSVQPAGLGRLGATAAALAFGALAVLAALTALAVPLLLRWTPLDAAGGSSLRAAAPALPSAAAGMSSPAEWLVSLVPVNPIRAAADGALLPLSIFVVVFACALRYVAPEPRRAVVLLFDGVAEALLQVVRWVLLLAPVGVFALTSGLGAKLGVSAVGALGYFVVLLCVVHVVVGLALYPVASSFGRVSLRRFASAAAPAQAVAFTTRSSLAALPAMLEGAERLGVPRHVSGFVLPLAASMFRLTSAVYWTLSAALVARLYGVEFGAAQIAVVALASATLSFGVPGVPMGGLLIQAPLYAAVGLPVEGLAILMAIDAIPDMFKTALNVTADMVLVAVLGRPHRPASPPELAPAGFAPLPPVTASPGAPGIAYPGQANVGQRP
jgi:proton glutamate symport protein